MKRAARPGESESESDDEGEDALERRALAESRAASSGGAALRQVTSARPGTKTEGMAGAVTALEQ